MSIRADHLRNGTGEIGGPSCILPARRTMSEWPALGEPLELAAARLLSVLALLWDLPGELAERELSRALTGSAVRAQALAEGTGDIPRLDEWKRRRKRRRLRVDRRDGRVARGQTRPATARGRAA